MNNLQKVYDEIYSKLKKNPDNKELQEKFLEISDKLKKSKLDGKK